LTGKPLRGNATLLYTRPQFTKRRRTAWRSRRISTRISAILTRRFGKFSELSDHCHEGGPLDDKSRRLVKLAIAVAAGLEGGTHSAVRHAKDAGISQKEMEHVAVLAITTIGFPSAMRALSWIRDAK
jgi:4-carboxymuconolactone decarboxylase